MFLQIMSLSTKLKDKIEEHLIKLLLGLIVLLCGAVWAAVPSELWDRVSAATPKRALWSAIALLAIGLTLETAYVAHLRRKIKLKPHFGVLWNKALVPHCPACSSVLSNYGRYWSGYSSFWAFKCLKCDKRIVMSDEAGNQLELPEAKDLISAKLSQKPRFEYVISQDEEKILVSLSQQRSATAQDLSRALGLDADRATDILERLERNRYIYAHRTFLGLGTPDKYRLNDRGREFLQSKDLI
jgi:DNA-binding MarR family transcriptional regulator